MASSATPLSDPSGNRQPGPPWLSHWLENLRRALARQRQIDEEATRLQIRRRVRS
jgi:hypothetical protein